MGYFKGDNVGYGIVVGVIYVIDFFVVDILVFSDVVYECFKEV